MYKQLFEIIDCALNDQVYDKEIKDSKKLSRVIAENGLVGLVYEYIHLDAFDEKHQMLLKKSYYQYIAKDVKQNHVIEDLDGLMSKHGYDHIFLKGSHLKLMYPKPYMRGMGDIDLLVRKNEFNQIKRILIKNGYKLIEKYYFHDTFQSENGSMIELHPFIQHDFDHRYEGYFMDPFNQVESKDINNQIFKPDYELTYLLYHLVKHIKHGGIGVRSILDIYIFVTHETIDYRALKQRLIELKLLTFFETIMNVFNEYFKQTLDIEGFNFNRLDENEINDFVDYISKMGIHGSAKDNNVYQSMIGAKHLDNQSRKFKYLLKVAFPGYKKLSYRYKVIKYVPILLPFYWLIRIFKLLIFKSKTSFQKLKTIKETKKTNQHQSMIDKLDL